ncbi:MAG: right-handed parallel beta-helix repeat-containing protein [Arenimonas sp.]
MRSLATVLAFVALLVGAALPRVALATPSLDACTQVLQPNPDLQQPFRIWSSGTFCLDRDWTVDVDATDSTFQMIVISMENVVIDCRGHKLTYTGAADASYGVVVDYAFHDITVRNCELVGFSRAIELGSTDRPVIEDNVIRGSRPAYDGSGVAIAVQRTGRIVRNRIYDSIATAIRAGGDTLIADNLIDGVTSTASFPYLYAIELSDMGNVEVRGNTIRRLVNLAPGSNAVGIRVSEFGRDDTRVRIAGNVLAGENSEYSVAFECFLQAQVTDNVVSGFALDFGGGCTDAGDNDVSP